MSDLTQPPYVPSCVSTGEGVTVPTATATPSDPISEQINADIHLVMLVKAQRELAEAKAVIAANDAWHLERLGNPFTGRSRDELEVELSEAKAEVARMKASDEFNWNIIKGCMDELEMVDMGASMIRGEIQEWKYSHARLKDSNTFLRVRVAELEADKARLIEAMHKARDNRPSQWWQAKIIDEALDAAKGRP